MEVTLGADVVATLAAPGDLDLGARIEVPVTRAIASYWRRARFDTASGLWTVTLEPPIDPTGAAAPVGPEGTPRPGEFVLVWRDGGPEPPIFETFIPLTVT